MSIDLEAILNQSVNDEYNRISNIPIGNAESKNIDNIFKNIQNITECLICCEDSKPCIKCHQCTAYYCKVCLIKIASDFNKCSTCGVNLKENYKKIKTYNEELQDTLLLEKAIANSLNDYVPNGNGKNGNGNGNGKNSNSKNSNTNNSETIYNDSDEDEDEDEDEDKNKNKDKKSKPKPKNKNKLNLKPSLMNMFKKKNQSKKSNNNDDDNENNDNNENNKYDKNNNINIIDKNRDYINAIREDKIYNINFTSYVNEISPNKPNYTFEWNHTNKTLTFYSLCNQNNEFINIIINYNILQATFQSVLYLWLTEIVKLPLNSFKTKWNKLADKINNMSSRTDNISNQEIKKFTKEIVAICKN